MAIFLKSKRRYRILDIGGSCSLLSRKLQQFGIVVSVEPDQDTVKFAKENLKVDCREGNLPDDLPDFKNKFDVVTMFDVLEHVEEEKESLQTVHQVLDDDGVLIITVPAYQWLWSDHDEALHHKRRYTTGRLTEALEANGFGIERITYYTTLLFPFAVVVRILSKLKPKSKNHQPEYNVKVPNVVINQLFLCIMKLESLLIDYFNLPFGLSIFCICKKK